MKRSVSLILLSSFCAAASLAQQSGTTSAAVVHVATALNHLTVLEFHEPVTLAAAGSSDFQIERESSKVFVKPVKLGAATDLFVWTASRRFAYELETTQEVKTMNFVIDSAQLTTIQEPALSTPVEQLADVMLTRALMGAEEISHVDTRTAKNQVNVHVEQIFRTRTTVYLHYTIENNSGRAYHVNTPQAYQLQMDHSSISVPELVRTQLDQALVEKLAGARLLALPIAHAESEFEDVEPGKSTQGVVSIRQELNSPVVVQLVFDVEVRVTVVL
jgi:type IV secretory pathway VirB9-like protein